jgi:hypothetical protein
MTETEMKELQGAIRKLASVSGTLTSISKQDHQDAHTVDRVNMAHQHIGNAMETIKALMQTAAEKHFNLGRY